MSESMYDSAEAVYLNSTILLGLISVSHEAKNK